MKKRKATNTVMRILEGACGSSKRMRDGKVFTPEDRKRRLLDKNPELDDLHKRGLLCSQNVKDHPHLTDNEGNSKSENQATNTVDSSTGKVLGASTCSALDGNKPFNIRGLLIRQLDVRKQHSKKNKKKLKTVENWLNQNDDIPNEVLEIIYGGI